jgi:exodeoxyribonuclease VIII
MNNNSYQNLRDKVETFSWLYDQYTGFLDDDERKMYRGIGLSKSSLDRINKSVDHYFMEPDAETPAMRVGSAFHAIILEPDKFQEIYLCGPTDCDRRTAAGKKAWKDMEEENPNKIILNENDWSMIHYMMESVTHHGLASEMLNLNEGVAEETIMWNDAELGTLMKGRTDFRYFPKKAIIDLKSTQDASPDKLEKDLWSSDLRYHLQAAIYTDGIRSIMGNDSWEFYFIYVEKKPPYAVQVVRLPPKALEIGRIQYRENIIDLLKWLDRATNALRKGEGLSSSFEEKVLEFNPPAWLVQKIKKQNRLRDDL